MDAELGDETRMREYVQEKSGVSKCDVVWGNDCSEMELKYIDKWAGPDASRNQQAIQQEKAKWDSELSAASVKNFAQNKQRTILLGRLLARLNDANL